MTTQTPIDWTIEVQVLDQESGHPLTGLVVEAWDKDYSKNKNPNDLLWVATTNASGKCRKLFDRAAFTDPLIRHNDGKKPDIYFLVKDVVGNTLLASEVKANLDPGFHAFVLHASSASTGPLSEAHQDWTILGELTGLAEEKRVVVECYDKDYGASDGRDELIFVTTSDPEGKFEHTFDETAFTGKVGESDRRPDIYFLIKDLSGERLWVSEVVANLPAGLAYFARIDMIRRTMSVAAVPKDLSSFDWRAREKTADVIEFPARLASLTEALNNPDARLIHPKIRDASRFSTKNGM